MTRNEKPIDGSEICNIIKVAGKNRVTKIKIGEIEIEFSGNHTINQNLPSVQQDQQISFNVSDLPGSTDLKAPVTVPDILGREALLAQMDIEDPFGYEQLVLSEDGEKDFLGRETRIHDSRTE